MENVRVFAKYLEKFEFSLKSKMLHLLGLLQSRPQGFPLQNDSSGRSPGDNIGLVDDVTVS